MSLVTIFLTYRHTLLRVFSDSIAHFAPLDSPAVTS